MADAELAMGWRLRNMIATPGVDLAWFDQDVWARELGYGRCEANATLQLFACLRQANLTLLGSLPRSQWDRYYGIHSLRGKQTVADFVRMEAAHDLSHLRQIDGILAQQATR